MSWADSQPGLKIRFRDGEPGSAYLMFSEIIVKGRSEADALMTDTRFVY